MPRLEAAATSMVSMPAPARITSVSAVPALSASAVTFLLRTIRMCGSTSLIARGQRLRRESGCDTTVQPSSLRPSMPTFSNLSAMRTFIEHSSREMQVSQLSQLVHEQPAPQLGLEPGALGRHDLAGVGHRHELVERRRDRARTRSPSRPSRTRRSSSAVPRMPPTKSIRLSVRGSPMPRIGASTRSCSRETSSDADRIRAVDASPDRAPAGASAPSR